MKAQVLFCTLVAAFASAHALGGDDNAYSWNRAPSSEKARWVSSAVEAINARSSYQFTRGEITACLDSLFKSPVPKAVAAMTLGEAAAGCMAIIKNGG